MESLTELAEAPVDWLAEIPAGRTQVIAQFVVDEPDPIDLLTRLVGNTADIQIVNGPIGKWPPKRRPHEQEELRDAFLNEVHDFFCSDTKYSKERQGILREYQPGESSFVAGVTAAISPHVGGGSEFIVAGVAVTMTLIAKMGLNAWCAVQKRRRSTNQDQS